MKTITQFITDKYNYNFCSLHKLIFYLGKTLGKLFIIFSFTIICSQRMQSRGFSNILQSFKKFGKKWTCPNNNLHGICLTFILSFLFLHLPFCSLIHFHVCPVFNLSICLSSLPCSFSLSFCTSVCFVCILLFLNFYFFVVVQLLFMSGY